MTPFDTKGLLPMNPSKIERLEKAGLQVGDYGDVLGLTAEDRAFIEMRLAAAREVDRLLSKRGLTQKELAARMGTRQPSVNRMLRNPATATFDFLFRALLALGATPRKIGAALL